jgi:VWFA-related protein
MHGFLLVTTAALLSACACTSPPTAPPPPATPTVVHTEVPTTQPTVDHTRVEVRHVDASRFPQVTLHVRAYDAGDRFVDGLTAGDFAVTEDGHRADITGFIGPGEQPVAVVLVMDCSGSMEEDGKLEGAKAAARSFVSNLQDGRDQAGLIPFASVVETAFPLQLIDASSRATLEVLIDGLRPLDRTAYYDAVYQAVLELKGASGRRVVVALTDGLDNESVHPLEETTQHAQREGVQLHTISLGGEADESGLERMARDTGGEFHRAPTASELVELYEGIAQGLQEEYALTYTSPNPDWQEAARAIEVVTRVGGREVAGQIELAVSPTPVPTDTPTPEAPYPGLAGRIAFTRNPHGHQDSSHEIYLLDLDSGDLTRLTDNAVVDWDPDWSPDGRWIAFVSFQQGNYDVWVMQADGGGQTSRIALPAWDDYPAWSPDGTRLAIASTGETEGVSNSEIFVGTGTGDMHRVTFNTGRDEWPSWAPDDQWLACSSNCDGDMDIYLFTVDGGDVVQWTDDPAYDEQPAWSPDGQWIAFIRKTQDTDGDGVLERRDDGDFGNVWIGRRDGTEFQQLTFDDRAADPAWSPDGRHIVFAHAKDTTGDGRVGLDDGSDLWVVPAGGGDPIALTGGTEQDWAPDWSR